VVVAESTPTVETSRDDLFPEGVALVTRRAFSGAPDLFPEELSAMARAMPARLHEFALGRRCARDALALLGGPRVAIPVGRFRDPVWPFGYVGSITHCRGFCAAAVARSGAVDGLGSLCGVGIDGEPEAVLPQELTDLVCSAEESAWLASRRGDGVVWDRLFFCAKESAYKCLFPATHQFLEFRDVGVKFHPEVSSFDLSLPDLDAVKPQAITGRYAIRDGLVLAAATWREGPACP
jgi:4'-phosphopantetheinyl transferase EntD